MLVVYVIPISPNLHYFSIWFVCIFNHPTTFFSVLSNFLTSVVSCVTHSLGCEVVSRVNDSLSLFATCTLAFSIHLYAFSTVRLLPPPPPPPAKFALSFARSFVRSFIRSFACTSVHSCVRSFVRLFALRLANQSSGRLFAELLFRAVFCFSSLTFFFFFDVWSILSFAAGFSFFFARMHIAHLFNQSSLNWCQPVIGNFNMSFALHEGSDEGGRLPTRSPQQGPQGRTWSSCKSNDASKEWQRSQEVTSNWWQW